MQYRPFGRTGVQVSALGFGTMRLPLLDGDQGSSSYGGNQIDEETSIACLRYAIDQGVNYIDTAYNYLFGNSELVVGRALRDGYRARVHLATKCPTWLIDSEEAFDRILDEQLRKLQTDHIDMYLLHTLTEEYWEQIVLKYGLLEKMQQAKADGRIRFMGFSFHDELPVFRRIVDSAPWDFCQIQLNYVDVRHQAGLEGLHYAAERGLAVSIMEPLRGGYLVHPPKEAEAVLRAHGKNPVQFAFDFLWNDPAVSLLLSGMGTMEQLKENLRYAAQARIGAFDGEAEAEQLREIIYRHNQIGCTGCRYCEGVCPMNIPISTIFRCFYDYTNGNDDAAKNAYRALKTGEHGLVADCLDCRACEQICPQHIPAPDWLKKTDRLLR